MSDIRKLYATSDNNYLKRIPYLVGTSAVSLGGFGTVGTIAVGHNLDYIPFFQIGCDIDNDGILWSNNKVDSLTESSLGSNPPNVDLVYWITPATLTISIENNTSPASTGTRRVWWVIYKDYP